jgi:hypothetical protein
LETTSGLNNQSNMLAQVAGSKGTEWMVSSYNTWQQRSPLPYMPETNPSSFMRMAGRIALKENQVNSVLALSFKPLFLILGLILSVKSR